MVPTGLGGVFSTTNPIFQGGLGLMALGGLFATLKAWPNRLWLLVTSRLYVECQIIHEDESFFWLSRWLMRHAQPTKASRFRFSSRWEHESAGGSKRRTEVVLGAGERIFSYLGAKLWVTINEEREGLKRAHSVSIRCRTKHRDILKQIAEEIDRIEHQPSEGTTRIMMPAFDGWQLHSSRPIRSAASVVLDGELFETLLADMRSFQERVAWYQERGIPYRRGYLFSGPPGNGKSSLTAALAGALQRDLFVIPLGDFSMDDAKLGQLMSRVPSQALVVIEDIDTVFHGRDRKSDNKLTMSGLLNNIDGPLATEGRLLVMTTNHIERLDPALVRAGRIDVKLELKNATKHQARRLMQRMLPDAQPNDVERFAEWAGDGSWNMAALQGHLIEHLGTPSSAALPPKREAA